MSQTHHLIDYIEIPARDLAASRNFYAAAFGWTYNDYGPAYAGIQRPGGDGEIGGLAATEDEVTSGSLLVLLYSDDLDATVAAVRVAGGTILQEPYAFPGGRRMHFADPSGNELGVYTSAAE
ncbi:VOC family protein [Microlunatus speluncae]|uniref:VOC family protein n=1 Tax=Microlunatus speluncae TaxID=2594267 RepID=UPI0012665BF4|nr:VOC family protein [Microlunatus speluncae]